MSDDPRIPSPRGVDVRTAARRLARRARLAAALGEVSRLGAAALVLAGAAALLLRAFAGWSAGDAAWVFAVLVAVPPVAWWRARRRAPSLESAATWLDVRSGGSGAVVAALERPLDGAWNERAAAALAGARDALRPPALRSRPLLAPTLPALAFATLCLAVPLGAAGHGPAGARAALERRAEEVREQLAVLEETLALDATREAEFDDRLRDALDAADDGSTEAAFEALDRLELDAEALAERAADAAAAALARLGAAATDLAADPAAAREHVDALERELAAAGLDRGALPPELAAALDALAADLGALPAGAVGAEGVRGLEQLARELARLADLSDALRDALAERLAQLAESGLLEGLDLPRLEIDPALMEALVEALERMQLEASLCPPATEPGGT